MIPFRRGRADPLGDAQLAAPDLGFYRARARPLVFDGKLNRAPARAAGTLDLDGANQDVGVASSEADRLNVTRPPVVLPSNPRLGIERGSPPSASPTPPDWTVAW